MNAQARKRRNYGKSGRHRMPKPPRMWYHPINLGWGLLAAGLFSGFAIMADVLGSI